ncbi:MAG: chromosomal replication initiator protein DnaA [Planctomycetota bacterium]|nr:chromosomal replication initiator protein DnaA [Planctomycetota bacterium]
MELDRVAAIRPGTDAGTPTPLQPQAAAGLPTTPAAREAAVTGPARSLEVLWRELQHAIRARVEPAQFATWFQRAALVHADDEVLRFGVQNDFSREWLERYYAEPLAQAARETFGAARRIEVVVVPELALSTARRAHEDPARSLASASSNTSARDVSADQDATTDRPTEGRGPDARHHDLLRGFGLAAELGLNPKYTFDNFVVGPCNRFAHAAAMGAAEQPGKAYNPFFLHGSVGLGKTHLLQSMCFAILTRNPKARILYLSCETFVNHFISALENGDIQEFRNKYRSVDVLVVDDIQVLANKERTQEEFFHTFNTLHQQGKQIVLSSDGPPKDIPTLQERLVSRFKWGLVTEMEPPCYETRMAILKRKSRERGHELPDDVAALLAERIESNIRELEGAVTRLLGFASVSGTPLTCDFARDVLRDLFTSRRAQPAMGDILALVTAHYDVKLSELQSKRRTAAIVLPRQVAMYLARRITRHSLEEIGNYFGGRDHSTVLYGIEKVQTLMASDVGIRELVDDFLARLQVRPA